MELNLSGKNYVVTGAGSGIGRATALLLAKSGVNILATDRNETLLQETASLLRATAVRVETHMLDVTDQAACNEVAEFAVKQFGRLDGWVNNAGVSSMKRMTDLTEADWDFNMDVNAKGAFFGTQAAARVMSAQEADAVSGLRGKIINVASMASKRGNAPFLSHYVASKFAVMGFTQAAAGELAENKITVNAVCPGYVATSMQTRELQWEADLRGVTVDKVKELYLADTPLRRLETPEDVAKVIVFLASCAADFLTGESISVNGGAYMD
ncbi:MAG TPA: SDR family NAD(P)-dependent oxidoreductase [Bellilinea sp.]|nr:SDR family NAD(P)-dependent oxidoreductase [Bellilinea sp.]